MKLKELDSLLMLLSTFDLPNLSEKSVLEIINEAKEAVKNYIDLLKELKECPTCKTLKESNPIPEGDEICPNCGDREMLDKE